MARRLNVAEFQDLQAEGDHIDQAAEDAASAETLRKIGAPIGDAPAMADHLIGLGVERECTAQMSLHMITERVREAAGRDDVALDATESEIVAEAERIMASFDPRAAGPRVPEGDTGLTQARVYDVDANGEVRDWRRPDMTPDRGDVTEVRFSGGGAEDAQQASLFLVPSDAAFNGKLYRDAPELANIAATLIERHGFLSGLVNAEIRFYWRRKTGVSKGRVKIGYCKRASDLLGHFSGADFLIWLSATTARDGKFTDRQVEAALFHQLLHIETDDEGNFISARHDFEGFAQEIRHYGTWTEDLKLAVPAFKAAEQMGLFDVDEGIEDDDEDIEDEREEAARAGYVEDPMTGAGTLIHDDGTPLTQAEIEAQEAAELADDDEDLGDDEDDDDVEAFDPEEDGDDPLADPRVI